MNEVLDVCKSDVVITILPEFNLTEERGFETTSTSFIQNINSSINTTTYDSLIQTKKYKLDVC